MRIESGWLGEQGIADVVQRRAVFPGRQCAVGGSGEMLKTHAESFRRSGQAARRIPLKSGFRLLPDPPMRPKQTLKYLKNYTKTGRIQIWRKPLCPGPVSARSLPKISGPAVALSNC